MMVAVQQDPETRRAIRAFVRAHHPDVGGDPEAFAAGLAELRAGRDRCDAPVVVVHRPRGIRGLVRRFRDWRARRNRPPRVR
ncbi:hypothetical protein SAMN02982929_04815 [Saccharopolyspora kobensis]|uniref:Uncharacterized protein n=1 Tax=Saccharopolyspora kobensis TaxID=146035 RepID=A0A1H6DRB0_9PSEU|nr:hypothetical protein [Saccharopolyspora kobensis]SEG87604.1 hypothetical protein SAMN02982929_04815 [Saccharopolyspora kobensis]SFE05858.1 hypothetical protein SAMN05216506_108213 [Saccharopolyspora kobensis]